MAAILTDHPKARANTLCCKVTGRSLWLQLAAILLLAPACTSLPGLQGDGRYPEVVESGVSAGIAGSGQEIPPLDEVLSQASALHDRGEPLPAELAATLVDAAVQEQRWDIADAVVRSTPVDALGVDEYARFSLAAVNYFNQRKRYRKADQWLHSPRMQRDLPLMPAREQILLGLQRSETLFGLRQFSASAKERIFLHELLDRQALRDANADGIWRALQYMDEETLQAEYQRARSKDYRAWLELALLERKAVVEPQTHETQLQAWRQRWPNHPAYLRMPGEQAESFFGAFGSANKVAVMLPLSGPLSHAGKALRDGITAAHFAALSSGATTPSLVFLDSSSETVDALYVQAEQQGAEFILGPLQKDQVKALFTMPSSLPFLTLNFVPDDFPPPDNIVQFGLAAEDEAVQLADVALQRGAQNVLVLHVGKSWAERAAWAFEERWLQAGGARPIVRALSSIENYTAEIANSFSLHESEARRRQMQNLLGKKLEFKPRRRQDIDIVVMFANSNEARAIKPLLAYHYAGDLPVMGSSQVYDSNSPPNKNRDLNGVVFTEIPWVLSGNERFAPLPAVYQRNKDLGRLFAMGVDAYRLRGRLDGLKQNPYLQIAANTGNLSVAQNRVVRQLPLAVIEEGRAIAWHAESERSKQDAIQAK